MITKYMEGPCRRAGVLLCFLLTTFVATGLIAGCDGSADETVVAKESSTSYRHF